MAIVVGDLGEEDELLAQAMVQGLKEAQVTACLCWSTASGLTVLPVRDPGENNSAAPGRPKRRGTAVKPAPLKKAVCWGSQGGQVG